MKKIFLVFLVSCAFALNMNIDMQTKTLSNGLKVVVLPDHRSPLVWFQIWYDVGSSDEHNGLTGISHALEHMMFKGTKKHGPGQLTKLVDLNGGSHNAFTSTDYTCYWEKLPADKLELGFELESDRMKNLVLTEKDFVSEQKVILEERRMRTDDNPISLTYEQFSAALKLATPYQDPVIGWERDILNISASDMRQWYNKWYEPNNAVIVVAGDVISDKVFELANKYFGKISPKKINKNKNLSPVPQFGKKVISVKAKAEVPTLMMGIQVPSLKTARKEDKRDLYALYLLSEILTGSQSAIMEKSLVREQQVATSIDSSYDLFSKYDSSFVFFGIPADKSNVENLEKAIYKSLLDIANNPISEETLSSVKARVIAHNIYAIESPEDKAHLIGSLTSVGFSWEDYTEFVDKMRKVSSKQIQGVVKKYFVEDKFTIAKLIPT